MSNRHHLIAPLLLISLICFASAEAGNDYKSRPLSERVDRLERFISSQKQLELLERLKQLQQENQQLRALLDEQNYNVRMLREQQKEHYADLNRRLNQIEGIDKAVETAANIQAKESAEIIQPMSEAERKGEQKAYQLAYNELGSRRYHKARDLFTAFIQRYPASRYGHIAQYWIAEASYAQHNYKQAVADYQLLLDNYPFSPKRAEAELKKAYSYYELGNKDSARNSLNQLLINYPKTTEAGQAKRLLKKI